MEITYGDFEKKLEDVIRKWAIEEHDVPQSEYEDEYTKLNYTDGIILASDITLDLFLSQDDAGIKIIPDPPKAQEPKK